MASKSTKPKVNKSAPVRSRKGLSIGKNRLSRWVLLASGVLLAAAVWLYYDQLSSPTPSEAPATTQQSVDRPATKSEPEPLAQLAAQEPNRIKIAKADIDALIIPVGKDASGAMAAPDTATEVGWYDKSAMLGSSVNNRALLLSGHYGVEIPEVFRNVTKLEVGDEIEIMGVNGDKGIFRVSEIERLPREKVDMEKAFNYGGNEEALSLITCIGNFDQALQTYDERYIVYAKRSQ